MRKSKMIIAAACIMGFCHNAKAAVAPVGSFDDSAAIVIAKAAKLGRNVTSSQPEKTVLRKKSGKTSSVSQIQLNPNIGQTLKVYYETDATNNYYIIDDQTGAYIGYTSSDGSTLDLKVLFTSTKADLGMNPICVNITDADGFGFDFFGTQTNDTGCNYPTAP